MLNSLARFCYHCCKMITPTAAGLPTHCPYCCQGLLPQQLEKKWLTPPAYFPSTPTTAIGLFSHISTNCVQKS